jgi:hypothetical protein
MKKLVVLFFVVALFVTVGIASQFHSPIYAQTDTQTQEQKLNDCYCKCACWEIFDCSQGFCGYSDQPCCSPSCMDLSEGMCKCGGFGCYRTPIEKGSAQCRQECEKQFAGTQDNDGKCELDRGDNCDNTPIDCACLFSQVCEAANEWADERGCIKSPDLKCPNNSDFDNSVGRCVCIQTDALFTPQGCVEKCPSDGYYSEYDQNCRCNRMGYQFDGKKCVAPKSCPANASLEKSGGLDQCVCNSSYKPNRVKTACVRNLTLAQKLSEIDKIYKANINTGTMPTGNMNNFMDTVFSKFFGASDNQFTPFVCGSYQGQILTLFDKIRFSSDAETAALMEDFDYGPIMGEYGIHHAVVLYPTGSNWEKVGIVFDPWLSQEPVTYSMDIWKQVQTPLYLQIGPSFGGIGVGPSNAWGEKSTPYPTHGGTYVNPNPADQQSQNQETTAVNSNGEAPSTDPTQQDFGDLYTQYRDMVYQEYSGEMVGIAVHCPVAVYVQNSAGEKFGFSRTEGFREIDDASAGVVHQQDGTDSTFFILPAGDYTINLDAYKAGNATIYTVFGDGTGGARELAGEIPLTKDQKVSYQVDNVAQAVAADLGAGSMSQLYEMDSGGDFSEFGDSVEPSDPISDVATWADENWKDVMLVCEDHATYSGGECKCDLGYQKDANGLCQQGTIGGLSSVWVIAGGALCCGAVVFGIVVVVVIVVRKKKKA